MRPGPRCVARARHLSLLHGTPVGVRAAGRAGVRARAAAGVRSRRAARQARRVPVHPRHLPRHVHDPAVDHPPVRGLRHRARVQRALPPAHRGRHHRAVRRLRPAHPDGIRLRRPGGARGGRQGGRGDRLGGGHERAARRHPARPGLHLDDDQRPGRGAAAPLPARRREPGGRAQRAVRDHPERRPQGVHRPRHLHLPAGAVAAAGRRHLRLLPARAAPVAPDLDLRLPHGGGGGHARAGDRVHAGQREGVCPGRARRGPGGR